MLSYPAYWGEHFFPSSHASALLHYELLHADATLLALSGLLGISTISTPHLSPNPNSYPATLHASPVRSNSFALSPAQTSFAHPSSTRPSRGASRFIATECIINLRSLITHLKAAIEAGHPSGSDLAEVEPHEILRVIEANLGGVELIESAAMGDLRRGEVGEVGGLEAYFKGLTSVVCGDALALIPLRNEG